MLSLEDDDSIQVHPNAPYYSPQHHKRSSPTYNWRLTDSVSFGQQLAAIQRSSLRLPRESPLLHNNQSTIDGVRTENDMRHMIPYKRPVLYYAPAMNENKLLNQPQESNLAPIKFLEKQEQVLQKYKPSKPESGFSTPNRHNNKIFRQSVIKYGGSPN